MSNSRDLRFLSVPPNRAIESSEAAPPGQGTRTTFSSTVPASLPCIKGAETAAPNPNVVMTTGVIGYGRFT
jgi:hypothetical protein